MEMTSENIVSPSKTDKIRESHPRFLKYDCTYVRSDAHIAEANANVFQKVSECKPMTFVRLENKNVNRKMNSNELQTERVERSVN